MEVFFPLFPFVLFTALGDYSLEFVFFKGGLVGSESQCNSDLTTLFRSAEKSLDFYIPRGGRLGQSRTATQTLPEYVNHLRSDITPTQTDVAREPPPTQTFQTCNMSTTLWVITGLSRSPTQTDSDLARRTQTPVIGIIASIFLVFNDQRISIVTRSLIQAVSKSLGVSVLYLFLVLTHSRSSSTHGVAHIWYEPGKGLHPL